MAFHTFMNSPQNSPGGEVGMLVPAAALLLAASPATGGLVGGNS